MTLLQNALADSRTMYNVVESTKQTDLFSYFDSQCKKAANCIYESDVVIILAGAGMSEDSGLKTFETFNQYNKVSNLENFRILTAAHLNKNSKLVSETFWFKYRKDVKAKKPHEGYYLLKSMVVDENTKKRKRSSSITKKSTEKKDYYIYTSNIDGYFLKVFPKSRVRQIHGNINQLQCASLCKETYWNYSLKNSQICKYCSKSSRPRILFFNDKDFLADVEEKESYLRWKKKLLSKAKKTKEKLNVVLIEIGSGKRIITVRYEAEKLFSDLLSIKNSNLQVNLVRINPKHAELDDSKIYTNKPHLKKICAAKLISISSTSLLSLQKIYKHYVKKL
eukprot:snap_masked-scaffold_14-processed-gene-9.29-mRNA-1 protein AED:1.00 eAED:1.00 QI:0/0/0/0/1/1/2/0/335